MNLQRCDMGHFYDADKFASCPHCSGGGGKSDETIAIHGEDETRTLALDHEPVSVSSETSRLDDMGLIGTPGASGTSVQPGYRPGNGFYGTGSTQSVTEIVKNLTNNPPPAEPEEEDEGKTVRYYETESGVEPVVGWLVCVQGEERGQCFNLKDGRNFIGRSPKMDIVIHDSSVSREKHAIIIFEPRKREFLVQCGESSQLFYLNDNPVYSVEKLKVYDELLLGNTKLVFIPFCSEKFGWDETTN